MPRKIGGGMKTCRSNGGEIMSGVILSAPSRASIFALQNIAVAIRQTQTRLASGLKVNTSLDNPAAFFTASALRSRATALETILETVATAVKTVEAADEAITGIRSLVATAQSLATQALASPDTLAEYTGTVSGLTGATAFTLLDDGDTITVGDGTTTAVYTHAGGNDVQDFLDAVNNEAGLNVTASLNVDGRIVLKATSTNNIIIGGTGDASELAEVGLVAGTTTFTANATRESLAAQYDSIRTQIDQMISDAGYNGINLLLGNSLRIVFNETGTSSITIEEPSLSAAGLGISAVTAANGGLDFQTDAEINTAITELATATDTLATKASEFASYVSIVTARETFTQALIDTLNAGADSLVLADLNEEAANLLALQTRQQIATTSLSLMQETENSVLRLFGI